MSTIPVFEPFVPFRSPVLYRRESNNYCSRTSEEPHASRLDRERLVLCGVTRNALGFSNLMAISAHHGLGTLPAAWMEGHGHAQMFGWIGSFILGIGFYSQPAHGRSVIRLPLSCFILWASGVAMRWFANIYGWHWRALLPVSAGFELVAVILFLYAASHHKLPASIQASREQPSMEPWMVSVLIGTAGTRVRRDFQLCRVCSIGLAGWSSIFPSCARSEISCIAWLGICRSGGVGILGAMAAIVSGDLKARCSVVSGSLMPGHSGPSSSA